MPSLNKIVLIGRLTRDPEQSYTASNLSIVKFTIAVDRPYKDSQTGERKTDFFNCRGFRQTADFVSQYITKGQLVAVEGRVEINKIQGNDGNPRYFTDVVCDNVQSLQGRDENSGDGGGSSGGSGGGSYNAAPAARNGGGNGGGRNSQQNDNYFDDEDEPAPAPRPQARAAAPSAPAQPRPAARPAPKPAPKETYPDDDFDDSDPFADE